MMRIGHRRIAASTHAAVTLLASLAVMAMTTGALLTIHLDHCKHEANHDSQNCSLCQHLLIQSKKLLLNAGDDLLSDAHICRTSQPPVARLIENHQRRISLSRGPPRRS